MDNVLDIFTFIAEKENLKIGTLEKSIGASKGVLSRAIKNGTDVQSKWFLALVEKYPQYDYGNLIEGKFSTFKKNTLSEESGESYSNDVTNRELKQDLKTIYEGLITNFETISEGVFEGLKGQQKILNFINELDPKAINSASKNLNEFLKQK